MEDLEERSRPDAPGGARAGGGAAPPRSPALRAGPGGPRGRDGRSRRGRRGGLARHRHRADRGRRHRRRSRTSSPASAPRPPASGCARPPRPCATRPRRVGSASRSAAATGIRFTERGTRIDSAGHRRRRPPEAFPALRAPRRSRGARPAVAAAHRRRWLDRHLRLRRLPLHRRHPGVPPERGRPRARPRRRAARPPDLRPPRERSARRACPATCARRSSPWRTAASTITTASTGGARRARSCATSPARDVREGFSTITMQVVRNAFVPQPRPGAHAAPQADRALPRLPARARAHQAADPRALPQRHLPRQRRVRRRGGEPRPVRQERGPAHGGRGRDARRAGARARRSTRRGGIPTAPSRAATSCSA